MRLAYQLGMRYAASGVVHYAYQSMNLRTYLDNIPRGGLTEFAGKLGISSIYLSQLAARQDGRVPSAELCVAIWNESGRKVTREELRPDDFWKIWPDLSHLAPASEGA